jgi:uncharacterized protein YcbK (DUF882 family)
MMPAPDRSHDPVTAITTRLNRAAPGRRRFLKGAGAALVLLPLGAWAGVPVRRRSLSFVHTHTGERLSTDVHTIDTGVLDILADLRVLADHDEPYEVISGYRSPQTNAALRRHSSGVAEHSLHLQGRAIDVRLPGFATRKLRELALEMGRGGVGFYPQPDFVHLDNGRVRYW